MRARSIRVNSERGFVACEVGNTTYAMTIDVVQEIILPTSLTPIPHAPPGILGALDHRGEVVPIVDMGLRLGFGPTDNPRRKWVLVRANDRTLGLVVTRVHEVFRVSESELRPAPQMAGAEARSTSKVVPYGGSLAYVLDLSSMAVIADAALPSGEIV